MEQEIKQLYIVATPIGNLEDISARAERILSEAEVVLCEDTRVTGNLLKKLNISAKTISLHQHTSAEKISSLLHKYNNLAYVTDAGTPGISDPGNILVQFATEMNFTVSPIPGPCAVTTALSVSGKPTDKFIFLGFMPKKGKGKVFKQITEANCTVCFYESCHRIVRTLTELVEILDSRKEIVVCRELTKKFETIYRGTAKEVLREVEQKAKGEFVVIV